MQLRALEYIIAVDETRNFGRAAKVCFVSQPTLSIQIKKMEDYLGVRLFERSSKTVEPTSIGIEIIALPKAILILSDEIKEVSSQYTQNREKYFLTLD